MGKSVKILLISIAVLTAIILLILGIMWVKSEHEDALKYKAEVLLLKADIKVLQKKTDSLNTVQEKYVSQAETNETRRKTFEQRANRAEIARAKIQAKYDSVVAKLDTATRAEIDIFPVAIKPDTIIDSSYCYSLEKQRQITIVQVENEKCEAENTQLKIENENLEQANSQCDTTVEKLQSALFIAGKKDEAQSQQIATFKRQTQLTEKELRQAKWKQVGIGLGFGVSLAANVALATLLILHK